MVLFLPGYLLGDFTPIGSIGVKIWPVGISWLFLFTNFISMAEFMGGTNLADNLGPVCTSESFELLKVARAFRKALDSSKRVLGLHLSNVVTFWRLSK